MKWRKNFSPLFFVQFCLMVMCVAGLVGFGFGFGKWFDKWVFLPVFPNALDSAFIVFSAVYLMGISLLWRMRW